MSNARARIEAMPRVRFLCGRNWYYGPHEYELGVLWGKNLEAAEGDMVYQREFVLRFSFHFRLAWH